jgi:hypothetical protein
MDIDLISAMILPRSDSGSRITRITDYQRLYVCTCSCMFAINAEIPVWGHGEAMIYSYKVDKALNYEFIPLSGKELKGYDDVPHMGNEDMYFTSVREQAFRCTTLCTQYTYKVRLRTDQLKQRRRWVWGNYNIVYKIVQR